MLALIGKLSALYAQSHSDQLVGQTVNEIEVLTTNLARKIWQKIAIIAEKPHDDAAGEKCQPACKPGSVRPLAETSGATAIHLERPLPDASRDRPG